MLVLAMAAGLEATVLFHNTGTTAGWDHINQEHNGKVLEVTSITYNGSATAIKVTQTFDPSYTGRYHSEVSKSNVYRRGDTGFYGFAFRLAQDWEFDDQSYNIAQFIADFSDKGCDDYIPTSMVWIKGNQLYTRVKYGPVCPYPQATLMFNRVASVSAGEWHKVVVQASWQSDTTGFYKLWLDGRKVVEKHNIATTLDDGRAFQFRVGLYANGWHDDNHSMVGSQRFRQVWFDQIGAGSAFADADPGQW